MCCILKVDFDFIFQFSPHFTATNTHNDFFGITQLNPIQAFNIVYACVRLVNGSQVRIKDYFSFLVRPS